MIPAKMAEPIKMPFGISDLGWPEEPHGGPDTPFEEAILRGKIDA